MKLQIISYPYCYPDGKSGVKVVPGEIYKVFEGEKARFEPVHTAEDERELFSEDRLRGL